MDTLATRTFTLEDQRRFAELSGDHNPLHVDPRAARRLLFGQAVVHGIHMMIWALDAWLEREPAAGVCRLRTEFVRNVGVGASVECRLVEPGLLHLVSAGIVCATIRLDSGSAFEVSPPHKPTSIPCRTRPWDELARASGELALGYDDTAARAAFPRASRVVPLDELLAATRLVGMECPGEHSLFISLDLARVQSAMDSFRWSVARADDRFGLLKLRVEGPHWAGTLNALLRPAPANQLDTAAAARLVRPGEFAGQRALVVGGSRGLGEVTAKLLAAGGADVHLTYHSGAEEAARVVAEISAAGGDAHASALDVLAGDAAPHLPVTHLYYFATPFIFERSGVPFDLRLYHRFASYFVDGFVRTLERARASGETLAVLCPSTVALDEVVAGLAEYTAAKAAAESLCRHLGAVDPRLKILTPRLPRLRTDQTATVARVSAAEPADVMLPLLRALASPVGS